MRYLSLCKLDVLIAFTDFRRSFSFDRETWD
jgi:hypothetical protein